MVLYSAHSSLRRVQHVSAAPVYQKQGGKSPVLSLVTTRISAVRDGEAQRGDEVSRSLSCRFCPQTVSRCAELLASSGIRSVLGSALSALSHTRQPAEPAGLRNQARSAGRYSHRVATSSASTSGESACRGVRLESQESPGRISLRRLYSPRATSHALLRVFSTRVLPVRCSQAQRRARGLRLWPTVRGEG
jgi:hypothetical protein